MPKILFRADADIKSGTGDLLSLIYLSEYFKGWHKYFITKDTPVAHDICRRNRISKVKYIPHNTAIADEIELLNNFILKNKIKIVFFEITARTIAEYKDVVAPIKACVNFDGVIPENFDLIINWEVQSQGLYLRKKYANTKFLLGPEYAFLKKEILEKSNRLRIKGITSKRIKRILVFFGGFDEFNFTLRTIQLLEQLDNKVRLNIVIGAGYRFKKELATFLKSSSFSHYILQQNIKNMVREYIDADLVITSGGLSLFETIALKVPSTVLATYKHQVKRSKFFERKGYIKYLGFRKINKNKFARALDGANFCFNRKSFLVDTIPQIIYERYSRNR